MLAGVWVKDEGGRDIIMTLLNESGFVFLVRLRIFTLRWCLLLYQVPRVSLSVAVHCDPIQNLSN